MSPTTLAKLHAELSRLQRDSKQDSLAFDASVLLLFVWSAVHGALIGGGALLGGGALRGAGLALLGATATVVLAALLCGVFEGIGVRSSRLGLWLSWLVANALVQLYVAARAPWIAALVGPCAPLCLLVVERRVRRRAAQALEALVLPAGVIAAAEALRMQGVRDARVLNHVNRALRDRAEARRALQAVQALLGADAARCGFDEAALVSALDEVLQAVLVQAALAEALCQRRHSGDAAERRAAEQALGVLRQRAREVQRAASAASSYAGACAHELSGGASALDAHSERLEALAAAWRSLA